MSEPMRFNLKHFGQISTMEVAKDGEFVLHSDYARLKAEVERLKTLLSIADRNVQNLLKTPEREQIAKLTADYRDLEAENRRLRVSSFVTAVPSADYEKLKAENERLRKAGDAMLNAIKVSDPALDWKIELWKDAKQPPTDLRKSAEINPPQSPQAPTDPTK